MQIQCKDCGVLLIKKRHGRPPTMCKVCAIKSRNDHSRLRVSEARRERETIWNYGFRPTCKYHPITIVNRSCWISWGHLMCGECAWKIRKSSNSYSWRIEYNKQYSKKYYIENKEKYILRAQERTRLLRMLRTGRGL